MATPRKKQFVYELARSSRCHNCDRKLAVGEIVQLKDSDREEREALCRGCAGLAEFAFLPSGNAKLTKLAVKYSDPSFAVLKWSDLWKTYERQGVLVTEAAVARAKQEL